MRRAVVAVKDLVVPEGTFGTGAKAKRTEWCALCIFLSIWIPVYVLLFYVCIAIGWIEGMFIQTAYVNTLPIPSLIFCPRDFKCHTSIIISQQPDGWSPVYSELGNLPMSQFASANETTLDKVVPPPILPTGRFNLTLTKRGHRGYLTQVGKCCLGWHVPRYRDFDRFIQR